MMPFMSPGALGIMNGIGMPMRQQAMPSQVPINPMQAPQGGGMIDAAPPKQSGVPSFDPTTLAMMAKTLRGSPSDTDGIQSNMADMNNNLLNKAGLSLKAEQPFWEEQRKKYMTFPFAGG